MLLKEGASVSNINMQGDFTIHVAARNASEWILETLKEKGCDINQRHRDGSSPLHLAAESGNLEAVKWLLRNGAKLDDLDAGGKTPTDRAADAKKTHVVEWIKDFKIQTPRKRDEIRKQSHLKSNFKLGGPNEEEDAKGTRKPQAHAASRFAAEDAQHPSWLRQGTQGVPDDQMPKVYGGTSGGVVPTTSTTTIATNVESEILKASREGNVEKVRRLIQRNTDLKVTDKKGQRPLHLAALGGHDAVVKELLSGGADVAAKGPEGLSTIHYAAKGGHVSTLFTLLIECTKEALKSGDVVGLRDLARKGVDVDAVGFRKGLRPAHTAAMYGHINLLKNLREIRCDVKAETDKGLTALHFAANYNHLEAVRWLVEEAGLEVSHRSKDGHTALDYAEGRRYEDITTYLKQECTKEALKSGDVEGLRDLARRGVDVDAVGFRKDYQTAPSANTISHSAQPNQVITPNVKLILLSLPNCQRPLHLAALGGHDAVVKELLSGGADVAAKGPEGLSTIHYAAKGGHVSTLFTLLESQCDIEALTEDGSTALHLAALNGHSTVVEWLVKQARLKVTLANKKRETALDLARKAGKEDVIQFLVKECTKEALKSGDVEGLRDLARRGVDVDAVGFRKGLRPAHTAAMYGHVNLLKNLREIKCDVKAKTDTGLTALHYAANYNHLKAVRWLVEEAGLEVSHRSKDGHTALEYAESRRYEDITTYLKQVIQSKGARKVGSGEADGNRMTETGTASGGGGGGGAEAAGGGGTARTLRSAKTSRLLMLARTGDATGVRQLADEGVDLEAMSSDLSEAGTVKVPYISTLKFRFG
ncbi:ankyrin-1-like [Penaeus japonicus]|uniref:ankyrin-1-like n=1 Tax=Penaeus japonicus TaxID=27405 RepID=UPI001C70B639|nr:ankyrin-1-like [Penaeus japonicus]